MLWEALRSLFWWLVRLPQRLFRWIKAAPGRFVKWFKANRQERWGYFWWGICGIVVAVPELWAAFGGDAVLWPTISGTIGNLEVDHQWVAFLVIGLVLWAGLHVVRVTRERLNEAIADAAVSAEEGGITPPAGNRPRLAKGGRLTLVSDPKPVPHPFAYVAIAIGAVVVPALLFHELYHADDHRYVVGEVMYASIAVWWIVIPSWLAYRRGWLVPFPTLFQTFRDLERRTPVFTTVLASGLAILMVHLILYPWPATIPDTNRLHQVYECHPLGMPKKEMTDDQKEACRKLDEADLRPSPGAP
jgi:hypothetical protein